MNAHQNQAQALMCHLILEDNVAISPSASIEPIIQSKL
jgi:hypothetical protein